MSETDLPTLLSQPERQVQARSGLRAVLDAAPRTLTYKQWLTRLPAPDADTPLREISLLSSFTLETIEPFLQLESYLSGWRMRSRYVQYGGWQNELLQPAGPTGQAVVLLLHDAELLGDQFQVSAADALARLKSLLMAWRAQSATPLFLGVLQPAIEQGLAFGEPLARGRTSQRQALAQGLLALAEELPDLHLLSLDASTLGVADWFDRAAWLATRSLLVHRALPGLARGIARHLACLFRPRRKVLVLDLDNTLWGGVVGEDGVDGLALGQDYPGAAYRAFQQMALDLRASGVLLALASKNNEADALAVFAGRPEMLLKPEHFSAHRIDWQDKASNIASMAQQLGLGLDSLVFADDSAIECALVRQALPQVEVVELGKDPSRFIDKVLATQAFDTLRLSSEDRQRADSYQAEAGRQQRREQVTDMASFLADCQLKLSLKPATGATLDRMHQLLGKTNQFNFSLQRPSKDQLQALMARGRHLYSASLTDRFGDYGLIGILQLAHDGPVFVIENMALSCRALGRGVEDAMLAYAHSRAVAAGCKHLAVCAVRGPRNQQVLEYLDNAGFARLAESESEVAFEIATTPDALPWPPFVAVRLNESEGA